MLLIWIGALLIIIGVVVAAAQAIRHGRLSDPTHSALGATTETLEPKGRGRRLGLMSYWPALALMALGGLCLLAAAASAT